MQKTKLNRITINLTDEQVAKLPVAPTLTGRVMQRLGFDPHPLGRKKNEKKNKKVKKDVDNVPHNL